MYRYMEIPEKLQEYLEWYEDGLMLLKQPIPELLKDEEKKFQEAYNAKYNIPPWSKLPYMPEDVIWKYEETPIPTELKPYHTNTYVDWFFYHAEFKDVPKHLKKILREYKKAEKALNRKKDRRFYEQCYADEMCWLRYKLRIVDKF